MSGAPSTPKTLGARLAQASILVGLFAVLYGATRLAPNGGGGGALVAATGFLLVTGTLASELVELVKLPHLSGYLLAGIVAGPHVLGIVDAHTVHELTSINALALALIALEGGAELKMEFLRERLRSLVLANFFQSLPILLIMAGVFVAARPLVPFVDKLGTSALLAVALLWGAVSITRSPSATLAILGQTRASGPLARHTLTYVMTSDLVVIVLVSVTQMIARPLIDPSLSFSFAELQTLGHELLGGISVGTTLGLTLALYLRFVGKQLSIVLVAIGFGGTEVLSYLRFDPLLAFIIAGFVVQNLSKQGEKLTKGIGDMVTVVYVVFFATAGAHLDVPLLKALWPVALLLCAARGVLTYIASRIASRLAGDEPSVRTWGWSGLLSQAGLALGLASVVSRSFPSFGEGFGSLAIATVAINEMIGPVLFKIGLDRAKETSTAPRPSLSSLAPVSGRTVAAPPSET